MAGQPTGNLPPPEKLVSWLIERGLAADPGFAVDEHFTLVGRV